MARLFVAIAILVAPVAQARGCDTHVLRLVLYGWITLHEMEVRAQGMVRT